MENDEIEVISDATAILRGLEGVPTWRDPDWAALGFPVVARGRHAIFPVACSSLAGGSGAEVPHRLAPMQVAIIRYCVRFYGGDDFRAEASTSLERGYGFRIAKAGIVASAHSSITWWGIGGLGVVLVRSIDAVAEREMLALHVVPKEWLDQSIDPRTKREQSRARSMLREQSDADAGWSWPLAP